MELIKRVKHWTRTESSMTERKGRRKITVYRFHRAHSHGACKRDRLRQNSWAQPKTKSTRPNITAIDGRVDRLIMICRKALSWIMKWKKNIEKADTSFLWCLLWWFPLYWQPIIVGLLISIHGLLRKLAQLSTTYKLIGFEDYMISSISKCSNDLIIVETK